MFDEHCGYGVDECMRYEFLFIMSTE